MEERAAQLFGRRDVIGFRVLFEGSVVSKSERSDLIIFVGAVTALVILSWLHFLYFFSLFSPQMFCL